MVLSKILFFYLVQDGCPFNSCQKLALNREIHHDLAPKTHIQHHHKDFVLHTLGVQLPLTD